MRLKTLLGNYPYTAALKNGAIKSDRVSLDFVEFSPPHAGFKSMVRKQAFDVSEMAIVTYLIAKSFGKPMVLLPAVVMGRFQHDYALYNASHGAITPADLKGKRVGIRSFTTTTGAWLRGILANDYGVDLDGIDWVTFEEPHVAEYRDTTTRAPQGRKILDMLAAKELDAVIGDTSMDAQFKTLFPDPQAEAEAWYRKRQFLPLNHMVVVTAGLAKENPDGVREVFRLLKASKDAAPRLPGHDFYPLGVEAMRKPLEAIIQYAAQQKLIPRPFAVDELFDDTTRALA